MLFDFNQMMNAINSKPFKQITGIPSSCDANGNKYVELMCKALARPGDEKEVEAFACGNVLQQFEQMTRHTLAASSVIHWRVRPEIEVLPTGRVIEYREDGPDRDFLTDKRCVMDKNWVGISVYMRLTISDAIANAA